MYVFGLCGALSFQDQLRPLVSTFMHATDGGTKRKASLYPRGHGCVCFIEDALSLWFLKVSNIYKYIEL